MPPTDSEELKPRKIGYQSQDHETRAPRDLSARGIIQAAETIPSQSDSAEGDHIHQVRLFRSKNFGNNFPKFSVAKHNIDDWKQHQSESYDPRKFDEENIC